MNNRRPPGHAVYIPPQMRDLLARCNASSILRVWRHLETGEERWIVKAMGGQPAIWAALNPTTLATEYEYEVKAMTMASIESYLRRSGYRPIASYYWRSARPAKLQTEEA